MDTFLLSWFFVLGTIIGSFLNVVIYRLNTGKSLLGRSHCLSCGRSLLWYELVPVVSYLVQMGSCRQCHCRITSQYLCVELLTGLLFLLTAQAFLFDPILLLLNLGIVSVSVVILVYDLRHTIIPDKLVLYLFAISLAYSLWNPLTNTVVLPSCEMLLGIILGALIPLVFFGGLWYVSRGRWMGLGDAKLAVPLGLILGIHGSISMLLLAFWVGAIVSVSLLVFQKILQKVHKDHFLFLGRHLTMKSEVPFAPFLICAFFLVQLMDIDALAIVGMVFR